VRSDASNPFRESTFAELQFAIIEAIKTLEERAYRTKAEKAAFAQRLRFLLLALWQRFNTGQTIPGSPEMALDREFAANVEKQYMALYRRLLERETADLRVFVINRAADYVLGKEGIYWVTPGSYSPARPRRVDAVRDSDEGLRSCLAELHELFALTRHP
jgi:hypothetical protein